MTDSGFFTGNALSVNDNFSAPELIHESGEGWSQIYLVDRDGRFRVYKALKQEYRGDIRYETLLRKEYEIGYRMCHPCICEVYGYQAVEGLGHVVEMEWIDGAPLSDVLPKANLSGKLSRNLAVQLCEALAYCHSRQVIHRDVKPENIMVSHSGNHLKLIDFGLSDSESHSIFKSACGTRSFAAPEIIAGFQGDEKSDIYSLGKVLAMLHPSLNGIASKCMKTNPLKRYRDVASVAEDIRHFKRNLFIRVAAAVLAVVAVATLSLHQLSVNREAGEPETIPENYTQPPHDSTSAEEIAVSPDEQLSLQPVPVPDAKPRQKTNSCDSQPVNDTEVSDAEMIDKLFEMATQILESGQ